MKFLLDESADSRLASYLTDRRHDVAVIARDHPLALPDREVLSIGAKARRHKDGVAQIASNPAKRLEGIALHAEGALKRRDLAGMSVGIAQQHLG